MIFLFELVMKKDPIAVDEENEESEDEQVSEDDQVNPSSSRDEVLERPRHLPEPLSDLPQRDPSEHREPEFRSPRIQSCHSTSSVAST